MNLGHIQNLIDLNMSKKASSPCQIKWKPCQRSRDHNFYIDYILFMCFDINMTCIFPIEHGRTKSVCKHAVELLLMVYFETIRHNHLKCQALKKGSESNQAQFSCISSMAAIIC
jgi:hypothetical protein